LEGEFYIKPKLLLVGGGGHCRSVLDCLYEQSFFSEISILDDGLFEGDRVFGARVLGNTGLIENCRQMGYDLAFVAIGSVGHPEVRANFHKRLIKAGYGLTNVIDKTAVVSPYAGLGWGIFVGKNAIINANAKIGDGVIVNTAAVIEHDCCVASFAHISTGSVLCGGVSVGSGSHVGAKSVIRQGLRIGSNCMVGMGSLVSCNIPDSVTAYGNPCRVMKAETAAEEKERFFALKSRIEERNN
jgi:sugar O-acyltransferase (sialic acid O-acetyltransferase NeuD family)